MFITKLIISELCDVTKNVHSRKYGMWLKARLKNRAETFPEQKSKKFLDERKNTIFLDLESVSSHFELSF